MQIAEVLQHIDRRNLLPPLLVVDALARNSTATLSVVKDYITRRLSLENQAIAENERRIRQVFHQDCLLISAKEGNMLSALSFFFFRLIVSRGDGAHAQYDHRAAYTRKNLSGKPCIDQRSTFSRRLSNRWCMVFSPSVGHALHQLQECPRPAIDPLHVWPFLPCTVSVPCKNS